MIRFANPTDPLGMTGETGSHFTNPEKIQRLVDSATSRSTLE
jgi:hypothetical protein